MLLKLKLLYLISLENYLRVFSFTYDGQTVEIVSEYKHLGIIFKPSGSFTEAINYLCKKASKASICMRKAVASEYLNVNLFLKLYEQCVKPILLYCSEVWCLDKVMHRSSDLEQKYDILPTEKVQLKFYKILLGVHKSAANNAVRAELGIFPLAIFCLKSCAKYWLHVIELNDNNLVYNAYSDEISRDTEFSHKNKTISEENKFFTCMDKSKYIFQSKIASCSYSQIKRFLYILLEKMFI